MRAELLAALRSRIDTVVSTGDPAAIFAPETLTEIDRLLASLTNADGLDIEVMFTLGLAYWLRTITADEYGQQDTKQLDETRAGLFLMPLFLRQPDRLPDPVRESLVTATGKPEPAPGERKDEAAEATSNFAMFLLARFVETGAATEGRTAVALFRQAIFELPDGHPSHPVVLCNLGYAILLADIVPVLTDPAARQGEPPRVDELVALFRAAVRHTPAEHENYARCVNGLGEALRAKAVLTEDMATLDEAIATLRRAIRATPAGDLNDRLAALGGILRARKLDIPTLRHMLSEDDVVPVERALLQVILSEALIEGETGRQPSAKVDEAAQLLAAAAGQLSTDSVEGARAAAVFLRATMLRAPFTERSMRREEQTGHLATPILDTGQDKTDPWSLVSRLVGIDAPDGESRHAQLMDFARTVLNYPSGASMAEVMAKAVQTMDKQMEHLDPQERAQAMRRFTQSDDKAPTDFQLWDAASLDEIDALYQRLDGELPADGEDRMLLDLVRTHLRLARMMDSDDRPMQDRLDDMTAMVAEAGKTLPAVLASLGERGKMMDSLAVMGSALLSPFRSLAVVDEAIRDYRGRLADDPDDEPALRALAHSLFSRYSLTTDEADFQEAAGLTRRMITATSPLDAKLVMHFGRVATVRAHQGRLAGGEQATGSGSTRLTRMASNQAADAIAKFDTPGALEELEEGRAAMLSHALNTRHEVDALRHIDPALADEVVTLQDEITAGMNPGMEPRPGGAERYQEQARRWDTLVNRIKALPGFDRFLAPLPLGLADLRPAAKDGPVVTINVNPRRCDALVLTEAGLRNVPLPDLHADQVIEQAEAFHTAIETIATSRNLAGLANRALADTLAWLWDVIAEPVLDALGHTGPPAGELPRLWWSPTGVLNFLPLHAAGRHDTPGSSVIDRVVSSYTPTLRALMHSRSHPAPVDRTALAIAMPETPGQSALPAAAGEVAAITDRMGGPPPLIGPAATRDAVLAALPTVAVAHFACHTMTNPAEPAASQLLLTDGPLRITEISKLHLAGAELAYLSACATARGGLDLADEAIHAASAFQLAGYAQVVATLWEVDDTTAAKVTSQFYTELAITNDTPLTAARALHTVIRALRDEYANQPAIWAAYLHAGA